MRRGFALGACAAFVLDAARAAGGVGRRRVGSAAGDTLDEQIDHWLRRGYDAPDQAVAALTALDVDQPPERTVRC